MNTVPHTLRFIYFCIFRRHFTFRNSFVIRNCSVIRFSIRSIPRLSSPQHCRSFSFYVQRSRVLRTSITSGYAGEFELDYKRQPSLQTFLLGCLVNYVLSLSNADPNKAPARRKMGRKTDWLTNSALSASRLFPIYHH